MLNNMGAVTKGEMEEFAEEVLSVFPGWSMKWTKAGPSICIHDREVILIDRKFIGRYPWEAKEVVVHEAAHIRTWPGDMVHGCEFYREYIRLLGLFMLEETEGS